MGPAMTRTVFLFSSALLLAAFLVSCGGAEEREPDLNPGASDAPISESRAADVPDVADIDAPELQGEVDADLPTVVRGRAGATWRRWPRRAPRGPS